MKHHGVLVMRRFTILLALLLSCLAPADVVAQNRGPTLRVGDPAPALQVTRWLQGDAVTTFTPGKVYVVDFWATWCAPSVGTMPYLSLLHEQFKEQGLTVVGISTLDKNNPEDRAAQFVKERGQIVRYPVGWCADLATSDAYLKAARQSGLPCAFVVDRQGAIAYIGHPFALGEVVSKVLAGTWRGALDAQRTDRLFDEVVGLVEEARDQPEAALKHLTELEKTQPQLLALFEDTKLLILLRCKKQAEAEAHFKAAIRRAAQGHDAMRMITMARYWCTDDLNTGARNLALAIEATDEARKQACNNEMNVLLMSAQAYSLVGDQAKARAFADQAIAAAPEGFREQVRQVVRRYQR